MRKKKKFARARRAMLVLPPSMLGSAPKGQGWLRGSRLSLVLGLVCLQFLARWCQALGNDTLVADILICVAPGAQQARSTNYVANGAVGQGDREGERECLTKLSARETIEVRRGLGVSQVNPS